MSMLIDGVNFALEICGAIKIVIRIKIINSEITSDHASGWFKIRNEFRV